MPSARLTSIRAPREPAADLRAPRSCSLRIVADGRPVSFEALAGHEASTRPRAHRSWGRGAVDATARWLRRALAESARAWALAAGVPPDLYP
jgi:hypothetical protein